MHLHMVLISLAFFGGGNVRSSYANDLSSDLQQSDFSQLAAVNDSFQEEVSSWKNAISSNKYTYNYSCAPFADPGTQECRSYISYTQPTHNQHLALFETLAQRYATSSTTINPYDFLKSQGASLLANRINIVANESIKKIPFLAQTSLGLDLTNSSPASIYLDSFINISSLGKARNGRDKGIIFGQARFSGDLDFDSATINLGLGARYKISENALIGLNSFWDHRMVPDTTSHSRYGVGWEAFYKDFELRNNWYFAATGVKTISQGILANTFERVVPGWDAELSYRLPNYPELAFSIRAFRWDYISRADNKGVEGSVNWQATPNWNFKFSASNEFPTSPSYSPSNDDIFVSLKATYTFNKVIFKRKDYDSINSTRMVQPVKRRYDVLLERYSTDNDGWSAYVNTL